MTKRPKVAQVTDICIAHFDSALMTTERSHECKVACGLPELLFQPKASTSPRSACAVTSGPAPGP